MALVLTLRKGHDFYVEDERVVVSRVISSVEFNLKLENGEVVTVTDDKWVKLMDGVEVQAAIPNSQSKVVVRVSIKAYGKRILRGELYNKKSKEHCLVCKGTGVLTQKVITGTGFTEDKFTCPECNGV